MYIKYIYKQHVTMCSEKCITVSTVMSYFTQLTSRGETSSSASARTCRLLRGGTPRSCSPWQPTRHQRRPPQCAGREGMAAHVMSLALRASRSTTSTWVGWTEETSCEDTTPSDPSAASLQVSDLPIQI